uniref:Uncharacterized protein n=1 Tax=Tetradesmus obliquus TaxID=3088 RepID=A0A383WEU7_TETOB|eukprot:jgi/Sobl393_1/7076/SZX75692.1
MLCEGQRQLMGRLFDYLAQQNGSSIVPLLVLEGALKRIRELPADYSKNLNLSPSYVSAYPANIRELLQNHADHCRGLSRTHRIQLADIHQAIKQAAEAVGITQLFVFIEDLQAGLPAAAVLLALLKTHTPQPEYTSSRAPFVVGSIIEYYDSGRTGVGRLCVDMVNYATVLNPEMFTLGNSEKSSKAYTAGHFGEGMKVQINRLIREFKAAVSIITGPCCWSFQHLAPAHEKDPSLHLIKPPDMPPWPPDTSYHGAGSKAAKY